MLIISERVKPVGAFRAGIISSDGFSNFLTK
jgi:hypothetical protein